MDDSAIVELFWKRDEQALAATTENIMHIVYQLR